MKTVLIFSGFLLLTTAVAQKRDEPLPHGVIYGIAIGQDGQPAARIGLTARPPLGMPLGAILPHTITNEAGKYRFENLPWWGSYIVFADDENAGYSRFSTGPADYRESSEIRVTPDHPEAEFNIHLPAKAGYLQIHMTNRRTGLSIPGMRIELMRVENPTSPLFTMSCYSNHIILIPPNKDFLLHVTSDGFREWDESIGKGKLIHLTPGDRLTLDVQLALSE